MSSNSTNVSDTTSQSKIPGGLGYIGIFFAFLIVFVIVTYVSYRCKEARQGTITTTIRPRGSIDTVITTEDTATTDDDDDMPLANDGLNEVTISSFRKFTYSQLIKSEDSAASSSCSICLADYNESDLIRMLPDCDHFFHLTCVDPWLRKHGTCPVCRNSHVPTPLAPADA